MGVWSYLITSQFLTTGSLLIFLITFLTVLVVRKLASFLQFYRYLQTLPGDKEYSILYGNMQHLPKTYEEILALHQDYMTNVNSRVKRFWLGPYEGLIALLHPSLIKDLVKSAAPKTRGFGGGYEHSIPWFGESVLTTNGAKWYRDRKLINNAFNHNVLKNYVSVFNSAADTLLTILDEHAEKDQSFEMFHSASLCLFDVITKSTMSLDLDPQRSKHPYVKATKTSAAIWALRNKTLTLWPNIIFRLSKAGKTFFDNVRYIHRVDEEIIAKRRQSANDDKHKSRYMDFLDLILNAKDENGNAMPAKEVREHVDAIIFAGHDTGSASVSWFLYQMAVHPHHQKQVQEEIDSVMADRDDNYVVNEDMNSFPYLTMCLRESMRLNPAVPTISRRVENVTQIGDMLVPKGTIVSMPVVYIHRNPELWPKPLDYIPERFSPENMRKMDPYAYLPFSVGSRNCPGQHFAMMELKVILVKLLHRFEFKLDPNGPPVKRVYELIMKTQDGLWMKVKRRDTKTNI